jgi:hypothetical protein
MVRVDRTAFDWVAAARSGAILAVPVLVAVFTDYVHTAVFVALGCFNVLLLQFTGTSGERLSRSAWGVGLNAAAVGLGTLVGFLGPIGFPLIAAGLIAAHLVLRVPHAGSLPLSVSALYVMGVGFPGASVAEAGDRTVLVLIGGALALAGLAAHLVAQRRGGRRSSPPAAGNPPLVDPGWMYAVTVGVVAAAGFALALNLGLERDYWVMLTVVVVLRPHFGQTLSAGAARLGGTVAGAAVAVGLTIGLPEPPLQGLLIVVSVFAAFVLLSANYTLYSMALTIFVILLINLAYPGGLHLAETRVVDTALGGALALVAAGALWAARGRRPRSASGQGTG